MGWGLEKYSLCFRACPSAVPSSSTSPPVTSSGPLHEHNMNCCSRRKLPHHYSPLSPWSRITHHHPHHLWKNGNYNGLLIWRRNRVPIFIVFGRVCICPYVHLLPDNCSLAPRLCPVVWNMSCTELKLVERTLFFFKLKTQTPKMYCKPCVRGGRKRQHWLTYVLQWVECSCLFVECICSLT